MEKNYKQVQLSSKHTTFGYYGSIGGLIFAAIASYFLLDMLIEDFQPNILLALLIFVGLGVGCFFIMRYITIGDIRDNIIYLKKFNQVEKKYNLEDVENVKVYENRKDKYIILTMKKGSDKEKYLLLNWKVFYAGEKRNTETVLREILAQNKTK